MENELSTGAFARLCGLSKRTLFYYDEIGLLKPARVEENGYRVYTMYQTDTVSIIKLMQKIGMSLQEIQEMFQQKELTAKLQVMKKQKKAISEKIRELQEVSYGLDFLTARFAHLQEVGFDSFFEEELTEEEHYHLTARDSRKFFMVNSMNYGYQYGIIFPNEALREASPQFSHVFQRSSEKDSNFIKPKGRYRCVYWLLTNEEMMPSAVRFAQQINLSETAGPLYHEDYCSELAGYSDRAIIKLSILLKK